MQKISIIAFAAVVIYLLTAPSTVGQGGNPPASTKESGATSGHGMTTGEQTGKGGGNAEQQIRALQTQLVQAQLKGDTSFFEKNYADNATIVHSDGKLSSKAQEIANLKSGALKYDAVDVRELKVNVYGDTALVDGLSSSKGMISGKPFSGEFRTTRVWVKEKGAWRCAAFQATKVASPNQ